MPSPLLGSVIGNMVAQRGRVSQVRQAVGLEPNANLKPVAPSPPNGPAMEAGPVIQATQASTAPQDRDAAMLSQVQQFLDQVGPGQQALIDEERAAAMPQEQAPEGVVTPGASRIDNQEVKAALEPLAAFFKANGRLPSPDELEMLASAKKLEQELGRAPSRTELRLYLSKPDTSPRKAPAK